MKTMQHTINLPFILGEHDTCNDKIKILKQENSRLKKKQKNILNILGIKDIDEIHDFIVNKINNIIDKEKTIQKYIQEKIDWEIFEKNVFTFLDKHKFENLEKLDEFICKYKKHKCEHDFVKFENTHKIEKIKILNNVNTSPILVFDNISMKTKYKDKLEETNFDDQFNNKCWKEYEDYIIKFEHSFNDYNNYYIEEYINYDNNKITETLNINKKKQRKKKETIFIDKKKDIIINKIIFNDKKYNKDEKLYKLIYKENRCKIDSLSYIYENYGETSKNKEVKFDESIHKDFDKNITRFNILCKIYSYIKNNSKLYNSKHLFFYNTFNIINKNDSLFDLFDYIEKELEITDTFKKE